MAHILQEVAMRIALLQAGLQVLVASGLAGSRTPAAAAAERESVSVVADYAGTVWRVRRGGEPEALASESLKLSAGDELRTGPGSTAIVRLKDGSAARLGSRSALLIEEETPQRCGLRLLDGRLWVEAPRSPRRVFEVRTPLATASARAAQFSVEHLEGSRAAVSVVVGQVVVAEASSPDGRTAATRLLLPGQRLEASSAGLGETRELDAAWVDFDEELPWQPSEPAASAGASLQPASGLITGSEAAQSSRTSSQTER